MTAPAQPDIHRLCTFDLWLDCGHIATVEVDGWYPVSVSCCDRLGGTMLGGVYVPFASHVEYVNVLSERYERRPADSPRDPTRLTGRRPRTDDPQPPTHRWAKASAGRFPVRVGATRHIGDSAPPATEA
jgi:hypothetical protein